VKGVSGIRTQAYSELIYDRTSNATETLLYNNCS